jgi:3-hydroxyisobutyrate dehydrogenase-like beta-hydroxyacid dehydrogenase
MAETIGWLGTGRMGVPMASRLLKAGCDITVWNRTRDKAEAVGAPIADRPADLADRDLVFTILSTSEVYEQVAAELLSADTAPKVLVDHSNISIEASQRVRDAAAERGVAVLSAPGSGSPRVVAAGLLGLVVSGPEGAFRLAQPYLEIVGNRVAYAGEGEKARVAKICHNLLLAITGQALAETTALAEKAGLRRSDFLEWINGSALGSMFTRYKTPPLVNLTYEPASFTSTLLLKDVELGLDAARELRVPLPLTSAVHELVTTLIGNGFAEADFAALLEMQARGAGLTLEPENIEVDDGLGPPS